MALSQAQRYWYSRCTDYIRITIWLKHFPPLCLQTKVFMKSFSYSFSHSQINVSDKYWSLTSMNAPTTHCTKWHALSFPLHQGCETHFWSKVCRTSETTWYPSMITIHTLLHKWELLCLCSELTAKSNFYRSKVSFNCLTITWLLW